MQRLDCGLLLATSREGHPRQDQAGKSGARNGAGNRERYRHREIIQAWGKVVVVKPDIRMKKTRSTRR
jgi:hypothetical protein